MTAMPSIAPHAYPRRILLAVTGLSPQVVTETLYALAQQAMPFIPTEIHLITTREGSERARLSLLSEEPGWFHRFMRDFGLSNTIAFNSGSIHVMHDVHGNPLDDIRTPEDNEWAADYITAWVRRFTADAESALHVSIAGGRKTMGFYLGYALSLYGRPQDRLSHVLVSEPFESSWDFFYPTPYERVIQVRNNTLANCQDARVTLAEIPFVRLREGLPQRLLNGNSSFSETVRAAARGLAEPRLVLNITQGKAQADGEPIDLGPTEFAVLLWLVKRVMEDNPEVQWGRREEAEEFMRLAQTVLNPAGGEYERLYKAIEWRLNDPKALGEYFEPQKSRINKAFAAALGENAVARYQIRRTGARGASRYSLPLTSDQIEIIDADEIQ
ncbi:CRISPR-associated ring nuclease Csm6 [Tepidimonas charontis]|uniref:CRISPR-associated protein n=1 Tax=Tepidimonas charontis TaxID=2267262 RepID=A0A554XFQ4_9BURK|nr:CRISPR-associated ring nuclease Csm6 [Tepidimonas charontis]TSE34656.1 CRISPR-associated protein [Tepidimonas charontis]